MKDLKPQLCSRKLRMLSEPDRLRIIQYLSQKPRTVGELATLLKKHIVRVSHHLRVLRDDVDVNDERNGRFIVYRLNDEFYQPAQGEDGAAHLNLGCCRLELPKE